MTINNNGADVSDSDVILCLQEAAVFLKITEEQLSNAALHGEIPGVYISGQWRFSKRQIIQYCLRPLGDSTKDAYRRYVYHHYYRPDWSIESVERKMVSIREASEAIELSEETILQDMGSGIIHGFYQDSDWFFDYIDLCVYHHHYYMPGPGVYGAYHESSVPIFKAQDIIASYDSGERDFSCLQIEEKADFREQNLSGIDLSGSILIQANFEGTNLADADLRDSSLAYANFKKSNLVGADLSEARLYSADLSGANLSDAWFYHAQMESVKLNGTIIERTWIWPRVAVNRVE